MIKMIVYYRLTWGTLVQWQLGISVLELYFAEAYYWQNKMYYGHFKNSSYLEIIPTRSEKEAAILTID